MINLLLIFTSWANSNIINTNQANVCILMNDLYDIIPEYYTYTMGVKSICTFFEMG